LGEAEFEPTSHVPAALLDEDVLPERPFKIAAQLFPQVGKRFPVERL
jgi:hypothetical protein